MSPEQKVRLLERMYIDFDKADISQEQKDYLKQNLRNLMDRMDAEDCWSPVTQAYLDGMDKVDQLLKENKEGKVCLLHDCDTCPKEIEDGI